MSINANGGWHWQLALGRHNPAVVLGGAGETKPHDPSPPATGSPEPQEPLLANDHPPELGLRRPRLAMIVDSHVQGINRAATFALDDGNADVDWFCSPWTLQDDPCASAAADRVPKKLDLWSQLIMTAFALKGDRLGSATGRGLGTPCGSVRAPGAPASKEQSQIEMISAATATVLPPLAYR